MGQMFFRNANLLDGIHARQAGTTVIVENERIAAIYPDARAPAPAEADQVFDLGGKSLLPGLVAGHLHVAYHDVGAADTLMVDLKHPPTYIAVVAAKNAENMLKAGFTSGVSAGSLYNIDVSVKALIEDGVIQGPRILAGGREITSTGGPYDLKPDWWQLGNYGLGAFCDGPDEIRKTVREEIKRGVEIIKLYPEGGRGLRNPGPELTEAEIRTAVETAHARGRKVRAHALSKDIIHLCLDAGVDIIDHGDQMDEELIEEFARRGTFVLPSLYLPWMFIPTLTDSETARGMERWIDQVGRMLEVAQKAGVKLVTGDDFGAIGAPHTDGAKELRVYVQRVGLDPLDVLGWATRNAAEMMGMGKDLGTIEPGKLADLLVLDGDPTRDIQVMGDPDKLIAVVQGGRFVTSELSQTMPSRQRLEGDSDIRRYYR